MWVMHLWISWSRFVVTFKERADFPPAGNSSLAGELTQGSLQEKHRDTAAHEEDDVRNEERSFKYTEKLNISLFLQE